MPRWCQLFGESGQGYKFSGSLFEAHPVPLLLQRFLRWASEQQGCEYTQILVNWYDGPTDSISQHADDENSIVSRSPIYSFSFHRGPERKFWIHPKSKGKRVLELKMPDNSLLVMGGLMQERFLHSVPKLSKAEQRKNQGVDIRRINLTLRLMVKQDSVPR
eukprot:gb/GEZN01016877.1/.p1 GENE.gb/GEZN01016877.1/~~gb/GEZN01016877.1/.p1  ORF type:complete len:161 (+),score=13.95 gb/GEZN01016877.1/:243-725(+)